jgi:serine/threonine-protein phosphatase 6 regulatory ankyrin repeat subunit B
VCRLVCRWYLTYDAIFSGLGLEASLAEQEGSTDEVERLQQEAMGHVEALEKAGRAQQALSRAFEMVKHKASQDQTTIARLADELATFKASTQQQLEQLSKRDEQLEESHRLNADLRKKFTEEAESHTAARLASQQQHALEEQRESEARACEVTAALAVQDAQQQAEVQQWKRLGKKKSARWTPLQLGVAVGRADVIRALLALPGYLPLSQEDAGVLLYLALSRGHTDAVKALLACGINLPDHLGPQNEGIMAVALKQAGAAAELCSLLEEAGSPIDESDAEGKTPLLHVARLGLTDVLKLLVARGASPHTPDHFGETPLIHAVLNGRDETATCLLELRAEVSVIDRNGQGLLTMAVNHNCGETVVELLKRDFISLRVDQPDHRGESPLLIACRNGQTTVARLLLAAKASIEKSDLYDRTPLSTAAARGFMGVCSLLLQHGAKVDVKDNDGMTPLMVSATQGHEEVVALLLGVLADPSMENQSGQTALDLAHLYRHTQVVELLEDSHTKDRVGLPEVPRHLLLNAVESASAEEDMDLTRVSVEEDEDTSEEQYGEDSDVTSDSEDSDWGRGQRRDGKDGLSMHRYHHPTHSFLIFSHQHLTSPLFHIQVRKTISSTPTPL